MTGGLHVITDNDRRYAESLDLAELEEMMFDGVAICADGCVVEPDGSCPHGLPSPLLTLNLI
jgi:hypothetical protein